MIETGNDDGTHNLPPETDTENINPPVMGSIVSLMHGCYDGRSSWQSKANCIGVDPNIFFPERGMSQREAKEVCRGCVVRDDCLEYAMANGEKFGIWGGLSERERRRLRRQRAMARRAITSAATS